MFFKYFKTLYILRHCAYNFTKAVFDERKYDQTIGACSTWQIMSSTGGSYMQSFYPRIRVYAIEKLAFFLEPIL